MRARSGASWLGVALALVLLGGCAGSTDEADARSWPWGPLLPPTDSMKMEPFPSAQLSEEGAADSGKADGATPKANFNNAAFRVGWLNTSVVLGLATPVLLFAKAVSVQPDFMDGKWVWVYTLKSGADTYESVLEGWFEDHLRDGDFLNLELKTTCTACKTPLDNFLLLSGELDTKGTDGVWQSFSPDLATDGGKLWRIAYDVKDGDHRTITFTNGRTDGGDGAGDVVEYARDGDLARVSVKDVSEALDYVSEWSVTTGAGWLQVPDYNNGDKACWDKERKNADCP